MREVWKSSMQCVETKTLKSVRSQVYLQVTEHTQEKDRETDMVCINYHSFPLSWCIFSICLYLMSHESPHVQNYPTWNKKIKQLDPSRGTKRSGGRTTRRWVRLKTTTSWRLEVACYCFN